MWEEKEKEEQSDIVFRKEGKETRKDKGDGVEGEEKERLKGNKKRN